LDEFFYKKRPFLRALLKGDPVSPAFLFVKIEKGSLKKKKPLGRGMRKEKKTRDE